MYCTSCGHKLTQNVVYCEECGNKVDKKREVKTKTSKPLIQGLWEKGVDVFASLFNRTEDIAIKLLHILQSRKKDIEKYLIDRQELEKKIELKQKEINTLYEKIDVLNTKGSKEIFSLYRKLDSNTDLLAQLQQRYFNIESELLQTTEQVTFLENEKEEIIVERDFLRTKYDHLQEVLKENLQQLQVLYNEKTLLEENHIDGKNGSLNEKIKEIESLEEEKVIIKQKLSEMEASLLQKTKEFSEKNNELMHTQLLLEKQKSEIEYLQNETNKVTKELQENKSQLSILMDEKEKDVSRIIRLKEELEVKAGEILDYHEEIQVLEEMLNELEKESNEKITKIENDLAQSKYQLNEPIYLDADSYKILNEGYPIRFNALYQNCIFIKDFYVDFLQLEHSNRLKVERTIANINYNYDKLVSNFRKNSVKLKSKKSVAEYKLDQVGRIYLLKSEGKVHFYRISITKNKNNRMSQQRVIDWLSQNVK